MGAAVGARHARVYTRNRPVRSTESSDWDLVAESNGGADRGTIVLDRAPRSIEHAITIAHSRTGSLARELAPHRDRAGPTCVARRFVEPRIHV